MPELSKEQFAELIAEVRKGSPQVGLGSNLRMPGLGCGDGGMGPLAAGVYEMLALGSPRLALCRAMGIRMAPYYFNLRATFVDSTMPDVEEVGTDVKIVQDTLIDEMCFTIFNKSTNANDTQFRTQSDYYFNKQSGIEMTLDILGAPRPTITPKFTPLANIADALFNDSRWPRGFILTYTQQLQASFHASITLPQFPMEVVVTFQSWLPIIDKFVDMKNADAFDGLRKCGFTIDQCYCDRVAMESR
jgi:hypothetical protein